MSKGKKPKIVLNSSKIWWVLGGGFLITLYFNSKIQDPFNSPKMWLLVLIATWLIGHLIQDIRKIKSSRLVSRSTLLVCGFLFALLISAIFTDLNYTSFFGENQRRNGWITYFALGTFFISAALYIRMENIRRFIFVSTATGLTLSIYGMLQISGIDFVSWNNPYNAVISTVGNPNFAAAIMAVMAIIIFGPVLQSGFSVILKSLFLVTFFFILYVIYLSDARQGLLALGLGLAFYINLFIYLKNTKIGVIVSGLFGIVGVGSILGMLQIGPLTDLLYKSSVTVRGYYWRAGLEMFKSEPLTGIGVDRYGAYFKEFRESTYPLNYGFTITSSNAHNVPIQIFATAGMFAGVLYLALMAFIFYQGVKTIRKVDSEKKLLIGGIVSAWLAFQAQSIISIDNIGISIWGWILSGIIIGLANEVDSKEVNVDNVDKKQFRDLKKIRLMQPVISGLATLLAILLIVPLYRAESNMYQERMRFDPTNSANTGPLIEYANKIFNGKLVDPNYKLTSTTYLFSVGANNEAVVELEKIVKSDPRNQDAYVLLARYYEATSDFQRANEYREIVSKLDPWNSENYLKMGRNYKSLGNTSGMKEALEKILIFDKDSIESKAAQQEFIS